MLLLDHYEQIPLAEVAAFVQRCLEQGATLVVVTRLPDGLTCSVSVDHD